MAVFAFDRDRLVKIVKRGKKYYVYRLKSVIKSRKGNQYLWESKAISIHNYKPYEGRDVSSTPDVYFKDIERWIPFLIRYGSFYD